MSKDYIVFTPETWAEYALFRQYIKGMMKADIPGGSNGPNGPTFPALLKQKFPRIAGDDATPLPRAQYQGMVLVAVVDGQWGAAYTPAVESLT